MDFAQRELEKYGWTKGKGLGKTESGITEALKPKVKLNKGGIGLDIAKDHTDHWWERSFNNAASNLEIEVSADEVTIKSSINKSDKKKRKDLYRGFIKKGSNMTPDTEDAQDEDPEETISIPKLSDEELFKACGGRTSHKAARHGLDLSGKLARIQQQEEEALSATQNVSKRKRKKKDKEDKGTKKQVIQ